MELLKELLDNYIILKYRDRDLYYDIKDNMAGFKNFIQDKLGYNIILHQDFIKLEKFPGRVESWMGIKDFEDKNDYCFLILIIMFLEDKGKEEQFVLSQLLEYIAGNYEHEKVDWTIYSVRKSLVRALRFAVELGIMKLNDGDETGFANSEAAELLYENTGISKYIVRIFPIDIMGARTYKDFLDFAWEDMDRDRGSIRQNRVYRTITLSPILYNESTDDQDFYYVKNYKNIIENDFEKHLGFKLHVHKDGAMLVLDEENRCKDYFPSNNAISDIALCFNKLCLSKIKSGEMKPSLNGTIAVEEQAFLKLLAELRNAKSEGWSKEYRESTDNYLYTNLIEFMSGYNMISKKDGYVILEPLIGKVIGDYPEDYSEKEKQDGR